MHILVTNDDGPPSQLSSPYVHSFIRALEGAGHTVSVVLPNTQKSWIGKAYMVGKALTASYFRPGTLHTDDGTIHDRPRTDDGEEWILIDGTPASCSQIGINHYFKEKGLVDLVVSGPNYGRNSTALFALSSGTIGAAMEAAVCGKKAIALSFAFFNRNHDPEIIRSASSMAVKIVNHLANNWGEDVDLYTVNIPLIENVDSPDRRIIYTNMLQNVWSPGGSCFEEVEETDAQGPEEAEAEIREGGEDSRPYPKKKYNHKTFKWAPKFTDVHQSVEKAPPGNDGWAVQNRHVSVTPLRANFMHGASDLIGTEFHLDANGHIDPSNTTPSELIFAIVNYEDVYVRPKIVAALQKLLLSTKVINTLSDVLPKSARLLDWSAYEKLHFDELLERPTKVLACSYVIRKALIRKHHLGITIRHHTAKHPTSALVTAYPQTCDFELDYAEFLDEALTEAYELTQSLDTNSSLPSLDRTWWILKPGMSDRGQGIRLFSSLEQLTEIFESFEVVSDDDDEKGNDTSVITSQLRHFVAQEYIHPPLLVDGRKFHIRAYVLAVGGLKVYVYREMLALFAATTYSPPWEDEDLKVHLTNTCLQTGEREGSVRRFWDLEKDLGRERLDKIFKELGAIVGETFEAAAKGQRVHFQTMPNVFEIFGVDFMVSEKGQVCLLEVNSYPDFKQTGEELEEVIAGLFEAVVETAVKPFFFESCSGEAGTMVKVLETELGSW